MSAPPGDPYQVFAAQRRLADAVAEEVEATPSGPRPWFGVYRWDAVRSALHDPALSAQLYDEVMGLDGRYGDILIGTDGSLHRRQRAVLQPAFARATITGHLRPLVEAPIDRLVRALAPHGSADLLADLCVPMPELVLTALFGLPDSEAKALGAQATVLTVADRSVPAATSDDLHARLQPVIGRRRTAAPTEDLLSVLAHARFDDRPLTDLEVFSHVRLLAIAGTDTVARATANLLFALLADPDQLDAVRKDSQLAPAAVDEAIRWECPALSVPRFATEDTRIGDVAIPRGSAVRCNLGAANRDPTRWPDPDRFDLFREPLQNAGLGLGLHSCLGVHLAHLVMEHTVRSVLEHLPGIRFDESAPPAAMAGQHLRAPTHLRARW